ncbi:hypothetical protein FCULG_00004801 [Fusarium culmorum]|uniref:Uncharacterized protein n=1 Tax=Fusarium culmorum TaxID=5516 RepID=A0A2T4H763_FUSCU|nr:hypothetical protein FCULG_00004801 [Fusarium culmorum]
MATITALRQTGRNNGITKRVLNMGCCKQLTMFGVTFSMALTEPQRLSSRNKRQQSKNTTVKPTPAMRRCIRNNAMDPWTYRDVHALLYSGFRVGWIKEPTSTHE